MNTTTPLIPIPEVNPIPTDSTGQPINEGDHVQLPWGKGVIVAVDSPRSMVKYDAGSEVLGAANKLIQVLEKLEN